MPAGGRSAELADPSAREIGFEPTAARIPSSRTAPASRAAGGAGAAAARGCRRSSNPPRSLSPGAPATSRESGVLLSVDGSDLPVGKPVRLTLVHPDTGEIHEVSGRVARHVAGEGTVAAVAIDFEAPGDAATLAGFVRDVHALEARRSARGIAGAIEELGIGNLVQMFGKFSRAGTFTATSGSEEGVVAFEGGCLRYCRLGALSGTKALARLLSWEGGRFEFQSEVDPIAEESAPIPLEGALLEATRQLDEMRRVEPGTLDPSARLRLDARALAGQSGPLSKTEEAVVDLAAAGLTVRRLLDVIPESDSQILEAIRSLAERGLIEILGGGEE